MFATGTMPFLSPSTLFATSTAVVSSFITYFSDPLAVITAVVLGTTGLITIIKVVRSRGKKVLRGRGR